MTSPAPSPPERAEAPLWSPFAALALVVVVISSFAGAITGLYRSSHPGADLPLSVSAALTVVQDGLFVLAAWLTLKLSLGRCGPGDLGLRRLRRIGPAVGAAAVVYFAFLASSWALSAIFGNPPDQQLVTDIKHEQTTLVLVVFAVMTCFVAPVAEEIFFRGFMFRVFNAKLGPVWGTLLASVIFGLVHAPNPVLGLIALAVLGAGLCLLYLRVQSIIPGMALHALNNSITFAITTKLHEAALAGLVVGSVGLVLAGATAVSARATVAA
jgi:membrane protease YdiL (CAAX protease family)